MHPNQDPPSDNSSFNNSSSDNSSFSNSSFNHSSFNNPSFNDPSFSDPDQPVGTFVVSSFRDALGLAMELADEYAFVNAGVVLTDSGVVTDIVLAEGIGRTIEPVTRWLIEAAGYWPETTKLLLLSVRPFDVDVIREDDLRRYRAASWGVAGAGGDLIDWIETDGDLFRSYAYVTCPANAWNGDRPEDRLSDGSPW